MLKYYFRSYNDIKSYADVIVALYRYDYDIGRVHYRYMSKLYSDYLDVSIDEFEQVLADGGFKEVDLINVLQASS